jgi:predicted 3-demethylubiquinone-9 3-methyltransferase (glyoxalase superfamily)
MHNIHPCIWFDSEAEEAAQFYCSIFPNSRIKCVSYFGPGMPRPEGTVLSVNFELNGLEFMAINVGPGFRRSQAMSLVVDCANQAEIDELYARLSADPADEINFWLKDRYGVSWHILFSGFVEMLADSDPARVNRVFAAAMQLNRHDIATIEAAYNAQA